MRDDDAMFVWYQVLADDPDRCHDERATLGERLKEHHPGRLRTAHLHNQVAGAHERQDVATEPQKTDATCRRDLSGKAL